MTSDSGEITVSDTSRRLPMPLGGSALFNPPATSLGGSALIKPPTQIDGSGVLKTSDGDVAAMLSTCCPVEADVSWHFFRKVKQDLWVASVGLAAKYYSASCFAGLHFAIADVCALMSC